MFKFILLLLTSIALPLFGNASKPLPRKTKRLPGNLNRTLSPNNLRYPTFSAAFALMEKRNLKTIVETGTARYGFKYCKDDGCSTGLFACWAYLHDGIVYSVDIDLNALLEAQAPIQCYDQHIRFVCSDSVQFLQNFNQPIDFLYLDSFDLDLSNPIPSQEHHLQEIIAAYPWLHEDSVIMIDDCGFPCGGKGKLAIDFLLEQGWKIYLSAYQVILVRKM